MALFLATGLDLHRVRKPDYVFILDWRYTNTGSSTFLGDAVLLKSFVWKREAGRRLPMMVRKFPRLLLRMQPFHLTER